MLRPVVYTLEFDFIHSTTETTCYTLWMHEMDTNGREGQILAEVATFCVPAQTCSDGAVKLASGTRFLREVARGLEDLLQDAVRAGLQWQEADTPANET